MHTNNYPVSCDTKLVKVKPLKKESIISEMSPLICNKNSDALYQQL